MKKPLSFLHIADIHLGCNRYQLKESPGDFFDAWIDVLQKYAIGEKVDFVIMCGDFFHKKSVPPETMNHAVAGLTMMKEAGIPVVSIEGNHDQKATDSDYSWLRSLADWGLLILLEPTAEDGKFTYLPWDEKTKRGGYIDIGQARIFGSDWFGASGNLAIPMLTQSIAENRREDGFHILMLHTDVEGHQMHPIPALSISALSELKAAVEYVGLGHTHMHYEIDNWAFNPGSIEVTNIAEFRETRGAFVVEVDEQNTVNARHVDQYTHRPFQQLAFDVTACNEPHEVTAGALDLVRSQARVAEPGKPNPILEVALRGRLGFPNSQLELVKIRDEAKLITDALCVRMKNHTVQPEDGAAPELPEDVGRAVVERRVVETLVLHDSRYKSRAEDIANLIIGAKRMALGDEEPGKIAEFISQTSGGAK